MAETEDQKIEISDRTALSRYEIRVDGDLAGLADYRLGEDEITFTHTETRPEFGGQGLASKLVEFAVTDARSRNLEIIPICPFVKDWIAENPG
jgi:predicted GNAT family acetyltransferase